MQNSEESVFSDVHDGSLAPFEGFDLDTVFESVMNLPTKDPVHNDPYSAHFMFMSSYNLFDMREEAFLIINGEEWRVFLTKLEPYSIINLILPV